MIGVECEPLKVEMIVRAYVTGNTSTSIWTHYEKGTRVFCGHRLPEGLRKHEKLPEADPDAEHQGRARRSRRQRVARRDHRHRAR